MGKNGERNNKIDFKGITGYFLAAAFIVIFALYCSGRIGWFLLIVLGITPFVSLLLGRIALRFIDISTDVKELLIAKNNHCALEITLNNRSVLPSPVILIELMESTHFKCEDKKLGISVAPKSTYTIRVDYEAEFSGGSFIGIKSVRVTDYLGLFGFKVKDDRIGNIKWKIGVIPEIMEISQEAYFLKNALSQKYTELQNDDTIDETSLMFSGFPGYDYREYQPGDPLKRINTKLSAKLDVLMVRLDEKKASSSMSLALDKCFAGEYSALTVQNTLEALLGIIRVLLWREYAVDLYIYGQDGWEKMCILEENELVILAERLGEYTFLQEDGVGRLPMETMGDNCSTLIFCTPVMSEQLDNELVAEEQAGIFDINVYIGADGSSRGRGL